MPFTLNMPKLSPTMEQGTLVKWHKKEGDSVEAGDLLIEVATDKATVEHQALDPGILRKILVQEGEEASINQPLAIFTETPEESIEGFEISERKGEETSEQKSEKKQIPSKHVKKEPAKEKGSAQEASKESQRILASPLAKKIAKEKGIDISQIKGSGPNQRVMSRDLETAVSSSQFSFQTGAKPPFPAGTYEEIPLSAMRKAVAKRLQESKSTIPHFYLQMVIDAEPLAAVHDQLRNLGIKVSINDCVAKAVAMALRKHPEVNSGFNSESQTIIRFKTIDLSIAVSVQGGLITPIVQNADFKNLAEISAEIRELAKRAREGKLQPHEFQGGSFTISNLGMYGIANFQAIINPPQASVLAVGAIHDAPVIKNGTVVPGKTMTLTLSADHRVVDGVAGSEFLNTLQSFLENPVVIFLE